MRWMSGLGLLIQFSAWLPSALAQSPVPIESVATIQELVLEVQTQSESLSKTLANESGFEEQKDKSIRQAFGLLACLGQAIAEHPHKDQAGIDGPALRDAALKFNRKGSYADAQSAREGVNQVLAGNITGEHALLHPWNKLINMHPMMEEMNARNSQILKVLKRPRGKPDEPLGAMTWAVLAIAMQADTHEVKDPGDLPKWNAWCDDFRNSAVKLAEAIRAQDKDSGRMWFDKANETCDACHEVFHKE